LANFPAKKITNALDKPQVCRYNAKPLYDGLTDMGHMWYKDIGFGGLGLRAAL